MRRFIFVIFLVSFTFGFAAIAANKPRGSAPYMVRVAIARDARELDMEIEGQYTFLDTQTGKQIAQGARLPKSTVRLMDKGIFAAMKVYPAQRILVQTNRDAAVIINNHRFRGDIFIIRTKENRLTVVNNINIEDYIKGVLYHEVSHHWPMEALKTQAVAARTYALYSSAGNTKDYDVTNDIYSQVYGGRNSERYRTGLAVERTAGEVLVHKGKILPAYFHASCGGMTEDAKELWNIDLPPLKGVPCLFCADSPHKRWVKNFQLKAIQDKLNKRGFKIGLIKEIDVAGRNRSGRILGLKITGRDDRVLMVKGKDFRDAIGPNILKSNNYEIVMKGYYADMIGKGWGHGVGMCQWGARGMAMQQFNYRQILNYYYPGAEIVDYHEVR